MFVPTVRSTARLTVLVVIGLASVVSACSSDGGDDSETPIVSDPNVPFDPDVPEGVDTDTNEVGNQGFDADTPGGPLGNNADISD